MTPDALARYENIRRKISTELCKNIGGGAAAAGYYLNYTGAYIMPHIKPLLTHIDTLTARVAALEDALRPFTEIGGWYGQLVIPLPDDQERAFMLPNGWLNKARTALSAKEDTPC